MPKENFSGSCSGSRVGWERMGCAVKKHEPFDPIDATLLGLRQTML
jgi:hypothetical protein